MRIALLLLSVLLFTTLSCRTENENYFFSYKINGNLINTENYRELADNSIPETLALTFEGESSEMNIIIYGYDEEGVYEETYMSYLYTSSQSTVFGNVDITITKVKSNKYIEGDFSGDVNGEIITEGRFRMEL